MGYMNEFPHSRMFDSDLREILEMYNTLKGLPNDWNAFKETMMTADWSELKNFVNTYFKELNVQNEINNKIDALVADGTMEEVIRPIFENYNTEMRVLKTRVDNLTALGEGSTTGDAELLDARVDYKGNTHANVGDNIRQSTSELQKILDLIIDANYQIEVLATAKELIAGGTNNTASVYKGDGVVTIGTGDYGTTMVTDVVLEKGLYLLYGVESGIAFLSTQVSYNGAFVKNTTNSPKLFMFDNTARVYLGHRNDDYPTTAYDIKPCVWKLTPKSENFKTHTFYSNLTPSKTRYIQHRGCLLEAPENSIPAFRLAGEKGAWGIECDLYETSDGELIIMHDSTVDRMTNGSGDCRELTYSEIRSFRIDSGSNVGNYSSDDLIVPNLEEVLQICKRYGMVLNFEVKGLFKSGKLKVIELIKKYRMEDSVIVTVYTKDDVINFRALTDDRIHVDVLVGLENLTTDIVESFKGYKNLGIQTDCDLSQFDKLNNLSRLAQSYGLTFGLFTITSSEQNEIALNLYSDYLITNLIN